MRYRIKDYKAFAREALLGHYGTVIGAGLLQSLICLLLLFCAAFTFVLGFAGLLPAPYSSFAEELRISVLPTLTGRDLQVGFAAACAILTVLFLLLFLVAAFLLGLGQLKLCLNLCSGRPFGVRDLFYAFREGAHPLRCLGVSLLLCLLLCLLAAVALGVSVALTMGLGMDAEIASWIYMLLYWLLCLLIAYPLMLAIYIVIDRPDTRVMAAFGQSWRYMKGRRLQYFWLMNFSFLFWGLLMYATFFVATLWIGPYIVCTGLYFYLDASGRLQQREKPQAAPAQSDGAAEAKAAAAEAAEAEPTAAKPAPAETAVTAPAVIEPEATEAPATGAGDIAPAEAQEKEEDEPS